MSLSQRYSALLKAIIPKIRVVFDISCMSGAKLSQMWRAAWASQGSPVNKTALGWFLYRVSVADAFSFGSPGRMVALASYNKR